MCGAPQKIYQYKLNLEHIEKKERLQLFFFAENCMRKSNFSKKYDKTNIKGSALSIRNNYSLGFTFYKLI